MCTGLTEKLIGVLVMLLKYFNTNYIIQRELVNMSKKYSSFEKDEIRFDNWRKFLNEQEDLFEEGDEKPKKEKKEKEGEKEEETEGSGSEDFLTPGKKAKTKALPKDFFKGKPPKAVPVNEQESSSEEEEANMAAKKKVQKTGVLQSMEKRGYGKPPKGYPKEHPKPRENSVKLSTDKLKEQTMPNPAFTGQPRPEFGNTIGAPSVPAPSPSEVLASVGPEGPAGIDIDPAAKAHMERRPEFEDLGVEDEYDDYGNKTGNQVYRTSTGDALKFGSDMDFLSNRTPFPSLSMARRKGLIDQKTNRLTDRGRNIVQAWKGAREKKVNERKKIIYHNEVLQEIYDRMVKIIKN